MPPYSRVNSVTYISHRDQKLVGMLLSRRSFVFSNEFYIDALKEFIFANKNEKNSRILAKYDIFLPKMRKQNSN